MPKPVASKPTRGKYNARTQDSVTRQDNKRAVLARAARSAGGKARAPIVNSDNDMTGPENR